jgi:hypothetical protein
MPSKIRKQKSGEIKDNRKRTEKDKKKAKKKQIKKKQQSPFAPFAGCRNIPNNNTEWGVRTCMPSVRTSCAARQRRRGLQKRGSCPRVVGLSVPCARAGWVCFCLGVRCCARQTTDNTAACIKHQSPRIDSIDPAFFRPRRCQISGERRLLKVCCFGLVCPCEL